MAYVRAVGEDGAPLADPDGQPIYIPVPLTVEGKGLMEVSKDNEMVLWDKMTPEQKAQYQSFTVDAQAKYFQTLRATRGKVSQAGAVPVIMNPADLEELKNKGLHDDARLNEAVHSAVRHALIDHSGVLTNTVSNLVKQTVDGSIFREGYAGSAYALPGTSPPRPIGDAPQCDTDLATPQFGMPVSLWPPKPEDASTSDPKGKQKVTEGEPQILAPEGKDTGSTGSSPSSTAMVIAPLPTGPQPRYYLAPSVDPFSQPIAQGYHVNADYSGFRQPCVAPPPMSLTIVHATPLFGGPTSAQDQYASLAGGGMCQTLRHQRRLHTWVILE